MSKSTIKHTPREKMDEPQVSKMILDIISTDDPAEKKRLIQLNQPPKKKNNKKEKNK